MISKQWSENFNGAKGVIRGDSLEKMGHPLSTKSKGGMGFRELGKFSDSMLAKQVWTLVHDIDSLFYRVF